MRLIIWMALPLLLLGSCSEQKKNLQPPVLAPFTALDTLAVNDWWNRADNPIIDLKVGRDSVVAFGIYTVSDATLKLSAQLYPLYPDETRDVRLAIQEGDSWKEIQVVSVNDLGWSALFRVEDWTKDSDVKYQI
ncbi:MAG TPA: hypothetical protein VKN36_16850, partial [Eudoraea sp.]|nr:hypothetical protein [Eudoraea sp.]